MSNEKSDQKKPRLSRKERARREFIRSIVMGTGMVGIAAMGFYPVAKGDNIRLRPPGALEENEFLAS